MLDSLVRKLSKLNKQNQLASSFSSSSSINKSTHQQQQANCVMLELFDLNQAPNHSNQICNCSTMKPKLFDIEHIYEEIEDDSTPNHKILLKEELINETVLDNAINTSKKKKCVRFKQNANSAMNNFQTVYVNKMASIQLASEQQHICLSCLHSSQAQVYLNSILKKPLETDLAYDHNNLIAQPVQLHVHPSYLEVSNENLCKSSSSSSSSASSSFYTTNSINSTTSSTTSNHSQVFNQIVEDFLNKVTLSCSNPSSTVNTLYNSSSCKKREKSINKSKTINSEMNSAIKNSKSDLNLNSSMTDSERLSFRVTNLTIDDLKKRQRQLDNLKKSNTLNELVSNNKFVPIQI
jgi:hypothetical protein